MKTLNTRWDTTKLVIHFHLIVTQHGSDWSVARSWNVEEKKYDFVKDKIKKDFKKFKLFIEVEITKALKTFTITEWKLFSQHTSSSKKILFNFKYVGMLLTLINPKLWTETSKRCREKACGRSTLANVLGL